MSKNFVLVIEKERARRRKRQQEVYKAKITDELSNKKKRKTRKETTSVTKKDVQWKKKTNSNAESKEKIKTVFYKLCICLRDSARLQRQYI